MSNQLASQNDLSISLVVPPSEVDYATAVERLLARTLERSFTVDRIDPRQPPVSLDRTADVLVVTGSNAHVNERPQWSIDLGAQLRRLLAAGQPVLGVCFGHQLLAETLGGTVDRLPQRRAGYRRISLTAAGRNHPAFDGITGQEDRSRRSTGSTTDFVSFLWHRDHVETVPPNARVLARHDGTVQAFATTDVPAIGVQFHPEVTPTLARMLFERSENRGGALPDDARSTLSEARVAASDDAHQMYANAVRYWTDQAQRFPGTRVP